MSDRMNPFQPGTATDVNERPTTGLLGKPLAVLVGLFVGGVAAGLIGGLLAAIAIVPPLRSLTQLDGEFDVLLLVMMPPMAGGGGALAGITLGLLHRLPRRRLIAGCVGSLAAIVFYSLSYDSYLTDGWEDSAIPVIVESLIMLVTAVASVFLVDCVLASVERRRAKGTGIDERSTKSSGVIAMLITMAMTAVAAFSDVSLYRILDDQSNEFPELLSIFSLTMSVVAIMASVYLIAAYPHRRSISLECGGIAIFGFALAMVACHSRIWL